MQPVEESKPGPSFVVLRREANGEWRLLGEVRRQPGLTARAARRKAVEVVTNGSASVDETYAAVLSSEWRVAQDI